MDFYDKVFEVIDMRSFSNLWFWIALAVLWSTASHYVLGVPYDLVTRAARHGGQAETDLVDLVRINVNRLLYIAGEAGLWLAGLGGFVLTMLAVLGFVYRVELCQALFLMAFPMTIVTLLSVRTARAIAAAEAEGRALFSHLARHRTQVQVVGMISIFVTALWGMYRNLAVGPFGG